MVFPKWPIVTSMWFFFICSCRLGLGFSFLLISSLRRRRKNRLLSKLANTAASYRFRPLGAFRLVGSDERRLYSQAIAVVNCKRSSSVYL